MAKQAILTRARVCHPSTLMRRRSISAPRCMWRRSVRTVTPSRCAPSAPSPASCTGSPTGSRACGIKTIAMESTGVYWIPAFEILDQRGFEVCWSMPAMPSTSRAARPTSAMPSGCSDCTSYGLLRASFRPKGEIAALRAYLRQRERLLDYAAAHIQHMQKALTQMNLQLHHVVTDITGATGMRIIRAIVAGERDPGQSGLLSRSTLPRIGRDDRAALIGNYREEHVFALTQALELYDFYQAKVADCDVRIEAVLERLKAAERQAGRQAAASRHTDNSNRTHWPSTSAQRFTRCSGVDLTQIHGIGPYLALKLVGECGTDLSAWPSAKHFTSWLCLAPGNKISGRQGAVGANPPLQQPGRGALRLAAVTRLGAPTRRWAPSIAVCRRASAKPRRSPPPPARLPCCSTTRCVTA